MLICKLPVGVRKVGDLESNMTLLMGFRRYQNQTLTMLVNIQIFPF
jgi:hypothetical protein